MRALPNVEEAAVTSMRPLDDNLRTSRIAPGDRALPPVPDMAAGIWQMVSPAYFRTMGIPLVAGRDLDSRDDDRRGAERVVVISETLAHKLWPGEEPLGKRAAFEFRGSPAQLEPQ